MRLRLLIVLVLANYLGAASNIFAQDETPPVIDLATYNSFASAVPIQTHRYKHYKITASEAPDANDVIEFSAKRYPFTPELLTSHDAGVCQPFEDGVKSYFFANHDLRKEDSIFGWGALPTGTFDIKGGAWLGGQREVLKVPANGNEKAYSAEITLEGYIHGSFEASLNVDGDEIVKAYTFGDVPLHLLWMNHNLYLYKNGLEDDDYQRPSKLPANVAGLYRIKPDGDLEETCTVLAAPQTEIAGPPHFRDDNNGETEERHLIETPHALEDFFDASEEVSGTSLNSQPCQGTDGPYVWTSYETHRGAIRYLALVRPWELMDKSTDGTLVRFLNKWGTNSLYNYRIYQKIVGKILAATQALAGFYEEQYGLSKAKSYLVAQNVMGHIIDASLQMGSDNDPEIKAAVETNGDIDAFRHRYRTALANKSLSPLLIRKAVLLGMLDLVSDTPKEQLAEIDVALGKKRNIDAYYLPEPLIFYSLDNEQMISILFAKGFDVNSENWFDKTPLMYAAQWNMQDLVNLLLAQHVNVNATTKSPIDSYTDCSGAPKIGVRTALMYAAENSSADIIESLLKAGAYTKAKDSEGKSIRDYLTDSELLSDDEQKKISVLLAK